MDVPEFLALISTPESRANASTAAINQWYDWATSVYRASWGDRFHFARFTGDETFEQACVEQENFLLQHLGLKPGMRVVDMGSGLGGPARHLASRSRACIVGVDLSSRRVELARAKAEEEGLADLCTFEVGDVTVLPHPDATFDAAYSIEVGCYVPEKARFYRSAARVVKPGGVFAGWDWALTRQPQGTTEQAIVEAVLKYQAKANLATVAEIRTHLEDAGFDVQEHVDLAESSSRPWWDEVERRVAGRFTALLAGARPEVDLLVKSSIALVDAARAGLLTPICFWRAVRRPG